MADEIQAGTAEVEDTGPKKSFWGHLGDLRTALGHARGTAPGPEGTHPGGRPAHGPVHTMRAIPIAITERMSAVRRSARCPQKDFFGPGSSASADRLVISSATAGVSYSLRVPDFFSSTKLA